MKLNQEQEAKEEPKKHFNEVDKGEKELLLEKFKSFKIE